MGVAEISKELNLGKASVFRMLYTLEKKDYIHKTSDAKYKLGIKFAHYGTIVLERQNVLSVIKPYLQKLRVYRPRTDIAMPSTTLTEPRRLQYRFTL